VNRLKALFLYLSILSVVISGCGDSAPFHKNISEGTIEYDVTYPELDSGNIMLEMLPITMVMQFKDGKFRSELKTAAGIIEMSVLADRQKDEMYNLVKIFSDHYALKMNRDQALEMTGVLPAFEIIQHEEQMNIAGANCKKIELDFKGATKEENYIFYFTDEVELAEPNWCTPYHEIQGVFLDYRIENYGMVMRLLATEITSEEIDDDAFIVNDDYKYISAEEFDEMVVKNLKIFME